MTERSKRNGKWKVLRRPLATLVLCGVVVTGLQGCIEMAVGTAVVSSMAALDRRTLGAQTDDKTIPVKANARLRQIVGDAGNVNVTSFNQKVLLTGEVRDEAMKAEVERVVAGVEGVRSVTNELVVDFQSSFSARSYDTLLTTKVKASLIDAKDLHASAIKVVTERNVVYLMGLVTEREGARAADIASGVAGVQKVVKLFDYLTEEQLQQLTNAPRSAQAQRPAQ